MSLFATSRRDSTRQSFFLASTFAHFLLIALVLAALHRVPMTRIASPGVKSGHFATVLYSPAAGYAPHSNDARTASAQARAMPRKPSPLPQLSVPAVPVAPSTGAIGLDARGDGDLRIALSSIFPQPRPDLSGFPRGFEGDVIVDVVIDEHGVISEKKLVHGISPRVDDTVMATLEVWRFTPAERDGASVASAQELLFHFGPV